MHAARFKAGFGRWASRIFLLIVTVLTLYPVVWNLYSAFKTNTEFLGNPLALPQGFAWDNFERAWSKASIGVNFMNSVYGVVILLAVVIVCVIPCAYVLARYRFFGSNAMLGLFMAAVFIRATYIMAPLFLQMNSLRLTEMVVPYAVLCAVTQFPFSIFLMTGFMRSIPRDFEEAAGIDGCGNFRILTQIIAPMAKPGIMTVCMLSAMAIWNEYPVALVMLTRETNMTLPIGLARLYERQRYATDWGALFAALMIVLIPTVIFYSIGQRYLIEGVSAGGVKG